MVALNESLSELREVAAQLNAASDELNAVIADLEQQLNDSGIGLTLWLDEGMSSPMDQLAVEPFEDDENRAGEIYWVLGYAKLEDEKWHIAVRQKSRIELSSDDAIERVWDVKPLLYAPRIVRVEAAGRLDALVYHLAAKAGQYVASITRAKDLTSN